MAESSWEEDALAEPAAAPDVAAGGWEEDEIAAEAEPEDTGPRGLLDVLTDAFSTEQVVNADPATANKDDRAEMETAMEGLKQVAPGIWIPESRSIGDYIGGAAEVAGTVLSSAVAEPLSGLAGGVAAMLPGEAGQGAEVVEATQEALTLEPESEVGKELMADLGSFLAPVGEFFGDVETGMGGAVLEATGSPALATAAHTVPTAMLEALGLGVLKKGSKLAAQVAEAQERIKIEPTMTPAQILNETTLPEARTYEQIAKDLRDKKLKAVAEDVRPDAQIMRDAEELGVSLNPADYSTNEAFIRVQQALKSTPGSQMATREAENIAILGTKADELIADFRGQVDKSILDDAVQTKMQGTIKDLDKSAERIYRNINETIPVAAKSPMRASNAYMNSRLEALGGDVSLLTTAEKKLHRMLNPKAKKGETPRPPTYGALDTLRRDIGDGFKNKGPFKDDASGTLKQVYKSLITDQSGVAKAYKMGEEFAAARKMVETRKQVEKGAKALFGREFAGSLVNKMSGAASGLTGGDVSKFKAMMKALPDDMRSETAMTMLNDLFTLGAKRKGDIGQGFSNAYAGLNRHKGAKAELFKYLPPEAQRRFDALGRVSTGIFRARSLENTSRTARDILQVLESGGMISTVYGAARPVVQMATVGIAQVGDVAASAAKKGAKRAEKADALLSSNEFSRALNTAMEGRVKEAEIMLKRSGAWKAFRNTLGEGTRAQLAAMGPIAWLTQQEEQPVPMPPPDMTMPDPASPGMPAIGPPPEVFPGGQ